MMPLLIVLALVKLLHLAFAAMDFTERLSREAERTLFLKIDFSLVVPMSLRFVSLDLRSGPIVNPRPA
jgi:hypothetical protein